MEINDCWSLIAVVKECARKAKLRAQLSAESTITTAITTTTTTNKNKFGHMEPSYSYSQNQVCEQFVHKNNSVGVMLPSAAAGADADGSTSKDELKDLCRPFLANHSNKIEPKVEAGGMYSDRMVEQYSQQQLQLRNLLINRKQSSPAAGAGVGLGHHCIDKKKKFEDRRVVRFTLEELSRNDKWAWRKYGQKPIKGSPYPRNYYRCSSMKGCKARKQVERSPIDSDIYIVTYTGHHYHPCPPLRNSNGSRVKFGSDPDPPPELESPSSIMPTPIRPGYMSGLGSNVVKIEDEEHDESFGSGDMDEGNNDYEMLIPNSMVDSDLLTGMEQLNAGEKFRNSTNGCDPSVKMEVQVKENGFGYDHGSREMYGSVPATLAGAHEPPSNMGQNIWDNGMIRPQAFLF